MNLNYFLITVFILNIFKTVYSDNILYISTTASPSHNIWDKTLALALRDKGHSITYVTHTPEKSSANFTAILMDGIYDQIYDNYDFNDIINTTIYENIEMMCDWTYYSCQHDFHTDGYKQVLQLAKDNVKFDLIVMDIVSGTCFYPIIEQFGYPLTVATSAFGIAPFMADIFGIDKQQAIVPHYALQYSVPMSFFQRLYNVYINYYDYCSKKHCLEKFKGILTEYYGKDMSHIYDIERNFSILLPNYDPIMDYPKNLPSNVIPVGGLHTKRSKSLTQDYQKYLDNSPNGVILFSLGTNIRADQLTEDKQKLFIETFSKLKQNVIWKFESELKDLPKNVMISKFLPQNDILVHPNVRLVINHGGALSTQEALYNGKPIIGIPFFIDQRSIVQKIMNRKLGIALDFNSLTVDSMYSSIQEVLNNPIYTKNAQLLCRHFRDIPDKSPLDRAVFWVEYVLRNNGAAHLKMNTYNMANYQLNLIDIWLFIIAIVSMTTWIITKLICYIICKVLKRKIKIQ